MPHSLVIDSLSGTLFCSTANHGVLKSSDNGASWISVNAGLDTGRILFASTLALDPRNSNHVLAGVLRSGGVSYLMETTDEGRSWKRIIAPEKWTWIDMIFPVNDGGSIAWVAGSDGIWRVDLALKEWKDYTPDSLSGFSFIAVSESNPDVIYAANEYISKNCIRGRLIRSANSGDSWSLLRDQLPVSIKNILIDPGNPDHVYVLDKMIRESRDGGKTWINILSPDTNSVPLVAVALDWETGRLYTGSVRDSVYTSSDRGHSWRSLNLEPGAFINDVVIDPRDPCRVYVLKVSGLFQSSNCGESWVLNPFDIISSVADRNAAPQGFVVRGPYPNPASLSTAPTVYLDIEVRKRTYIEIELFDIFGRRVKVVNQHRKFETGRHVISIPMTDLAPGMYFISLFDGARMVWRKMVALL